MSASCVVFPAHTWSVLCVRTVCDCVITWSPRWLRSFSRYQVQAHCDGGLIRQQRRLLCQPALLSAEHLRTWWHILMVLFPSPCSHIIAPPRYIRVPTSHYVTASIFPPPSAFTLQKKKNPESPQCLLKAELCVCLDVKSLKKTVNRAVMLIYSHASSSVRL